MATARVRKEIEVPAGNLRFVTVSPDGTRVAATAYDPQSDRVITCTSATSRPASGCSRPKAGPWPTAPTAAGWPSGPRMRRPCSSWMRETHETAARFRGHEKQVVFGRLQSRQPPPRLVQSGPHRSPVADRQRRVPGAARAHRRGLRGGLPPRRHAPGLGRPRPGGLAVGPGAGRGGGAAARATPATSGRWPSAPTARRWRPAPATSRSACGTRRR